MGFSGSLKRAQNHVTTLFGKFHKQIEVKCTS